MPEVSTFRLYLLRATYLIMVVGLGVTIWPGILSPPKNLELTRSVVRSLLGAVGLLAVLGIRYPLKMLPLMFFEFTWKTIWVLVFGLPLWSAGEMDADTRETMKACLMGIVFPLVIPWRYVYAHYVKGPGDSWRKPVAPGVSVLLLLLSLTLVPTPASSQTSADRQGGNKEKVTGIGGLFFRSRDPKALSRWYLTHLGINLTPTSYEEPPWQQEAGPTVFAPFADSTRYFGQPDQAWMVNFRVRDLDAMVAQLKGAGVAVKVDPEEYPNGRFARIHDLEGNPIELWEPRDPVGGR